MRVEFNDVTGRDGHQSLLAARMRREDIETISQIAAQVGFSKLELAGGASFDAAFRFKGEDPWENIRRLKEILPDTTRLSMLHRGQNLVGYRPSPDDVVKLVTERFIENGVTDVRVFDCLNFTPNLKTTIDAAHAKGAKVEGTICYTLSPVHNLAGYVAAAQEIQKMGADSLCIKDMAGLLEPQEAGKLIHTLKQEIALPITLHTHATMGRSDATIIEAIRAGVDAVDVASSGLSGGSGHSAAETILDMMLHNGLGNRMPDIDREKLAKMRHAVLAIRQKYAQWDSPYNPALEQKLYKAQVPGGMMSTFEGHIRTQAKSIGIRYEDALDCILEGIPTVRKALGWLPLVTPASQIVGSQCALNVQHVLTAQKNGVSASGLRRAWFTILSDDAKNVLLGELGKTPANPDPDLVIRAKNGSRQTIAERSGSPDTRPADYLENGLPKAVRQMEDKGLDPSREDDLCLVAMFGQAGLDFLKGDLKHESAPKKKTFLSGGVWSKYSTTLCADGDIEAALGGTALEDLAQTLLERQRLQDGFYKNISEVDTERRLVDANTRINSLRRDTAILLDHAFTGRQLVGATHKAEKMLQKRCAQLGVPLHAVPAFDTSQQNNVNMGSHEIKLSL